MRSAPAPKIPRRPVQISLHRHRQEHGWTEFQPSLSAGHWDVWIGSPRIGRLYVRNERRFYAARGICFPRELDQWQILQAPGSERAAGLAGWLGASGLGELRFSRRADALEAIRYALWRFPLPLSAGG